MRTVGVPLFSVDTHRAAGDFDVLAFNLSAELVYTNLLNLRRSRGRAGPQRGPRPEHPLVIAGGHCTYNPEPLAEYVDAFVLGDGEEVIGEIADVVGGVEARRTRVARSRAARPRDDHRRLRARRCTTSSTTGTSSRAITPKYPEVPAVVDKRTVADLAEWPYPKNQLVPLVEVVHDRLNVEIFRGCTRGCRFCQAGHDHPPGPGTARGPGPDHGPRGPAPHRLRRGCAHVAVERRLLRDRRASSPVSSTTRRARAASSVSLPSLRVDAFSVGIASEIQKVRRTGLTFAPEAGTWRLRQVINKLIVEDDLYAAVDAAYSQGWRRVKLYFLTGLPTEMDDDTLGIAELARNVVDIGRKYNKQASCTVSVGGFVPKPHTPFQWFGQNGADELQRKISLLRGELRGTKAQLKWHDPGATFAEGIASRGDRRIGRVIERVWRAGGTFQEWSEHFAIDRVARRDARRGTRPDWYVTRHRTRDEVLPWAHIAAGLHADFLWDDWQAALAEHGLPDCRWTPCYDCGVCTDYALEHVVASQRGAGGRLAGHRPGPEPRRGSPGRVPGHQAGRACRREGDDGIPGAASVHEAGQGPLDQPPRRCPAQSSAHFASPNCHWRSARASRRTRS